MTPPDKILFLHIQLKDDYLLGDWKAKNLLIYLLNFRHSIYEFLWPSSRISPFQC